MYNKVLKSYNKKNNDLTNFELLIFKKPIAMKKLFLFLSAASTLFLTSCNDDDSQAQSYSYSVSMTDAPAPYDAVFIDVQGVEVKTSDGATYNLTTDAQVYNLLELSNGVSIVIASDEIQSANVSQIRLILGDNNSIVVDGQTYPLATPSAQQSGLKLLVNQTLEANVMNTILIDFDAHSSIVEQGNGSYSLKPVLREVNVAVTGYISGSISTPGVSATVTAISTAGIEFTTVVDENGAFQLVGLLPGTYTIIVTPENPLLPLTIQNIEVMTNTETNLGVLILP